ncbi:ArsR/SmtB family transcription factor [Maritalea sp.]|uniref:ArsR/SmtB family transcription factor n=1 Tax=Maritalea sp. TaxID=2003361 RepID=UPI003EF78BA5
MSLHEIEISSKTPISNDLHYSAAEASSFLKAIAHEGRLMILCRLSESEASVSELEELLEARQAAVSQQLARLRQEGLVKTRRDGKAIYYSLADDRVRTIINAVHGTFC